MASKRGLVVRMDIRDPKQKWTVKKLSEVLGVGPVAACQFAIEFTLGQILARTAKSDPVQAEIPTVATGVVQPGTDDQM